MKPNQLLLIYFFSLVLFLLTNSLFAQKNENLVGKDAINFSLKTFGSSDKINLDKIGNETILIIEFWATWCGPCIQAFPHINDLFSEFKNEDIKFISVTYETDEEKLAKFFTKHTLNTTIAIDSNLSMFKNYNAWAIPQTIIIDKNRKIVANIHPNKLTKEIIEDVLQDKKLNIPGIGEQPYFDPKESEEYFKSLEKEVNK